MRVPDFTGNYFSVVSGRKPNQQTNSMTQSKENNFYANTLVGAVDLLFEGDNPNYENQDLRGIESLLFNLPYAITNIGDVDVEYVENEKNIYSGSFKIINDEVFLGFEVGSFEILHDNNFHSKIIIHGLDIEHERGNDSYGVSISYNGGGKATLGIRKNKITRAYSIDDNGIKIYIVYSEKEGDFPDILFNHSDNDGVLLKKDITNFIPSILLLKYTEEFLLKDKGKNH
nr:hypothetical protein [Candidatus Woesearchaeota archaeon]